MSFSTSGTQVITRSFRFNTWQLSIVTFFVTNVVCISAEMCIGHGCRTVERLIKGKWPCPIALLSYRSYVPACAALEISYDLSPHAGCKYPAGVILYRIWAQALVYRQSAEC